MIVLRKKAFSEEKDSAVKTAAKTLGVTALAAGTAFAGAKKGYLGANNMLKANRAFGNMGVKASNLGLTSLGEKMMQSGAAGVGQARANIVNNKLLAKGVDASKVQARVAQSQAKATERELGRLTAGLNK